MVPLLLASFLLVLPACARLIVAGAWPLLPKRVVYCKGDVVAYGARPSAFAPVSFWRIESGAPDAPFSGSPALQIRLPDGTVVRTDRLDASALRARSDRRWRLRPPSMRIDEGWRPGLEEIHVGGFRFLLDGERVVWMGAASSWEFEPSVPSPEIGRSDSPSFHRLPLTQPQLIELFGEPDSLTSDLDDLL